MSRGVNLVNRKFKINKKKLQKNSFDEYENILNNELEDRVKERTNSFEKVYQELQAELEKNHITNEALKESELRYRKLINELPIAIVIHDKGKFVFVNPAALKLIGAHGKNIIGEPVYKYLNNSEMHQKSYDESSLLKTEYISLKKEDGENIDTEISSMYVKYEDNPAILTIINDITERRKMEILLEENFGKQSILNEIYGLTLNNLDPDNLIKRVVDTVIGYMACDEFGFLLIDDDYKAEVFHGTQGLKCEAINIIKNQLLNPNTKYYKKLRNTPNPLRIDRLNNSELFEKIMYAGYSNVICYPLRTVGKFIGFSLAVYKNEKIETEREEELLIAICNQLSAILQNTRLFASLTEELNERKRSEKELRKLSLAVEQTPASVVITDPKGEIIYVNPAFTDVTGYALEEVIGNTPKILNSGDLPREFYALLWSTIRAGKIWRGEFLNKKKNGEKYWEAASISPVFDEYGTIVNYVSVKEDISGIRRTSEELRKAKEEAERANAAKSTFLANMSHEIRTPMNAILGFSQLLMKDKKLDLKQREYLESINRSGEHLLGLINDILEMSKIDAGHVELLPSVFDMNYLIKDVYQMLKERAYEKKLKLIIEVDSGLYRYVTADENKVRQIFINLIGNAIKFTEAGQVTWRVSSKNIDDNRIRLVSEIEDTGPGMSPEDMNSLFKAFEQTSTGIRAGGTGLGLAISQRFANLMNGEITVKSEIYKGSIFHIELDMLYQTSQKLVKSINSNIIGIDRNYNNKSFKLLVVDDMKENRQWLMELLLNVGFEVREASNGEEAIEMYNIWRPDMIFMDIHMPVMDGYQAAQKIRKSEKDVETPIIAITASIFEGNSKKKTASKFSKYIFKPFKEKEIFEGIKEFLDVKFIYDNIKHENTSEIEEEKLELLDEELINTMKEATINGDLDFLMELLDEASETIPVMAAKLREYAEDYRIEELLKKLE